MAQDTYGWDPSSGEKLLAKIKADLKTALKNKDDEVKSAIRVIMSEFPKLLTVPITLESGKKSTRPKREEEITDDDVLSVIQGLVKSERQTLELTGKKSSPYLEILLSYLPKPADEEEIARWIKENIDFSRYKSPMQAMGEVMKHFGKRADGKLARSVLERVASQG